MSDDETLDEDNFEILMQCITNMSLLGRMLGDLLMIMITFQNFTKMGS